MAAQGRGAPETPPPSTSQGVAAEARSWGDVPDNILVRISAFLPCRADRVHMASVNRVWNAAVRGLRRPPPPLLPPLPAQPPQLPWLIFPSAAPAAPPTFYSAITGRYHGLGALPDDVRRARFCGSGDAGWLVLALDARHNYALYNLDSGLRIPLPRSFTPETVGNFPLVVRVATFSAAPSPDYGYTVAAIVLVGRSHTAAFWSEGREHWFTRGATLPVRPQDVIYHRAADLFFVTSREEVISFRAIYGWEGGRRTVYLARVDYDMVPREDYGDDVGFVDGGMGEMRRYLVVSRGRLLMVVRYVYGDGVGTGTIRVFEFRVLLALAARPRATWDLLGNELDGRMLFLGPGCSRSLEVADYDGFEDSTIYFLDDALIAEPLADGYSFTDMGRYSMEDTDTEPWPPGHPTSSDIAPPTWWLP